MIRVGSLFSGIGGFDLGLERAGMSVSWQVEIEPYCNKVLAKHWPNVTRYGDIKTINWSEVESVDLVCGGFPCQPFSLAGKRRGKDDDRYLWPEVVRCLDTLRPTWFLGENVPGFASLAQFKDEPPVETDKSAIGEIGDVYHRVGRGIADEAVDTLESFGYQVVTFAIPACAVDAPHIRQRLWIVAYTDTRRLSGQGVCQEQPRRAEVIRTGEVREGCNVADAISEQSERGRNGIEWGERSQGEVTADGWERSAASNVGWSTEPYVGRVAYGVPARLDQLRGLGNAIVPDIAEAFGRIIMRLS